jgi:hypothetical protein
VAVDRGATGCGASGARAKRLGFAASYRPWSYRPSAGASGGGADTKPQGSSAPTQQKNKNKTGGAAARSARCLPTRRPLSRPREAACSPVCRATRRPHSGVPTHHGGSWPSLLHCCLRHTTLSRRTGCPHGRPRTRGVAPRRACLRLSAPHIHLRLHAQSCSVGAAARLVRM